MNLIGKHRVKLFFGLLVSGIFLYMAFRKVDFQQMWQALDSANYWYLLPAILVMLFSHYLRAIRWRYLIDPINRLNIGSLFSSLMIGYAANIVLPAHLGELLRAYVLSKKHKISGSSVFATIVTERVIDVFSLLALMALAIFVHPFPDWLIKSAYIMFGLTLCLSIFLILLKRFNSQAQSFLELFLKPFPNFFQKKIKILLEKFISGVVPLRYWYDYIIVTLFSALIWICYGVFFHLILYDFNFIGKFSLSWTTSLVLLVVTTIAVVVPSSPGYVGTYHYLCQLSLAMFNVPMASALSFAIVAHAASFLPVLLIGFVFAQYEGMSIYKISKENKLLSHLE